MCGAVACADGDKTVKVYFPNPQAALPVRRKSGDSAWLTWGRRREQPGVLPPGGWARLESVHAGKWQRYQPRPVIIPATAFMEKDLHRQSHWFPVPDDMAIQGLVATVGEEMRLYVVTVAVPAAYAQIHDRWPRLVVL